MHHAAVVSTRISDAQYSGFPSVLSLLSADIHREAETDTSTHRTACFRRRAVGESAIATSKPSKLDFTVRQLSTLSDEDLSSAKEVLDAAFSWGRSYFAKILTGDDYEFFPEFWGSQVVSGSISGEVYFAETPEKKVIGVAVWFGPGNEMYDSPEDKKTVLEGILFRRFKPELQKWWREEFLPQYKDLANMRLGEGVKNANWHLQTIGTHPDYQGKGVGTALIDVVAQKAKKTGHLLCLETGGQMNIDIYTKLGFETVGDYHKFVGLTGDVSLIVMKREFKPE